MIINTQLSEFDLIVLAVQPKNIEEILEKLNHSIHSNQLILSVITSVPLDYYEDKLVNQPVIRVMPNTSSMIGESATAISIGNHVTESQLEWAKMLLRSIGEVYVIPDQNMDVFTGIADSGPAYYGTDGASGN
ncbi:hypothetical protein J6TS2_06320 [Heyndrickxia sporothermodurans]|nr:hypothetical protein J6TS2_06320 [Heyndrickxia sporothermodurans]